KVSGRGSWKWPRISSSRISPPHRAIGSQRAAQSPSMNATNLTPVGATGTHANLGRATVATQDSSPGKGLRALPPLSVDDTLPGQAEVLPPEGMANLVQQFKTAMQGGEPVAIGTSRAPDLSASSVRVTDDASSNVTGQGPDLMSALKDGLGVTVTSHEFED